MLAYIKGKVIHKNNSAAIVVVNDTIGYQIFLPENFLVPLRVGEEIELYLHHQVREEQDDLYGFKNFTDLELFQLLLSVSGVGPKSALAVLALAEAEDVKEAIIRGDAGLLTKVSGIGKKTAERLVLELKSKVLKISSGTSLSESTLSVSTNDEIDALMALGYSLPEAREALNRVPAEYTKSSERVKFALKKINN
ncbi:MAG: Holliday junction branch migration protein RuvA [Patescibacteria group bacterium]